jgi:hypothetical protein
VTTQTTTHGSHPRPVRPGWWLRRRAHAAALSLAAAPAWAAGGYHITATITVGNFPEGVALNPAGTRAYVVNWNTGRLSVIARP